MQIETKSAGDIALYLHIPFCARKCAYCDFASEALEEAGGLSAARRYVDALAVEIDRRAVSEEFDGARLESVYLGGGTPTILPPEWMAEVLGRLRDRFAFEDGAEVTIEANPGTVDQAKIAASSPPGSTASASACSPSPTKPFERWGAFTRRRRRKRRLRRRAARGAPTSASI